MRTQCRLRAKLFPGPRPWRRREAPAAAPADAEADVAIAGAGPVGLLLAHLLARDGFRVALVEKRAAPRPNAMVMGLAPPSLDLLESIGLADAFRDAGVRIGDAAVHESGAFVGRLNVAGPGDGPLFILAIAQARAEELLARALDGQPALRWWAGREAVDVEQERDGARLIVRNPAAGRLDSIRARFVVACDGRRSALRAAARIGVRETRYAPMFAVSDYHDTTSLGDTAHLFFGSERPVGSFPIPDGRRRWIIRTGWRDRADLAEPFEESVARLAGHRVTPAACAWRGGLFHPSRREARRFFRGRLVLCGGAAHDMDPVVWHDHNAGFLDAAHLALSLRAILRGGQPATACLRAYERCRRAAFRRDAGRAAMSIWAGARTGCLVSAARAATVACLLANPARQRRVARWFGVHGLPRIQIPRGVCP